MRAMRHKKDQKSRDETPAPADKFLAGSRILTPSEQKSLQQDKRRTIELMQKKLREQRI
jgi:hypothetical protein